MELVTEEAAEEVAEEVAGEIAEETTEETGREVEVTAEINGNNVGDDDSNLSCKVDDEGVSDDTPAVEIEVVVEDGPADDDATESEDDDV